jgi:hypothetical protein
MRITIEDTPNGHMIIVDTEKCIFWLDHDPNEPLPFYSLNKIPFLHSSHEFNRFLVGIIPFGVYTISWNDLYREVAVLVEFNCEADIVGLPQTGLQIIQTFTSMTSEEVNFNNMIDYFRNHS